jgi:hypothetical protein
MNSKRPKMLIAPCALDYYMMKAGRQAAGETKETS